MLNGGGEASMSATHDLHYAAVANPRMLLKTQLTPQPESLIYEIFSNMDGSALDVPQKMRTAAAVPFIGTTKNIYKANRCSATPVEDGKRNVTGK